MNPWLTKGHENPHPHPYPLPEGEGISLPFKGRVRVGMGLQGHFRIITFLVLALSSPEEVISVSADEACPATV